MEASVAKLLTPDLLADAARRFGAAIDHLELLGDFENYVYAVPLAGTPAVLRLTHVSHRSADEIRAELHWLAYLAECGAGVARPLRSARGARLEELPTAGGAFFAVAFARAPGETVTDATAAELWNDALFREWGRTVGEQHRLTRDYAPAPDRPRRRQWYQDDLLVNRHLPPAKQAAHRRLQALVTRLRALPRERDAYGLIHSDVHPGNFTVHRGRLTVFDFDDTEYNYFVHDIAMALYYALWRLPDGESREAFAARFLTSFLAGYRDAAPTPPAAQLAAFPWFLQLRDAVLLAVMHKKWDMERLDPFHRRLMTDLETRLEAGVPCVEVDPRDLM